MVIVRAGGVHVVVVAVVNVVNAKVSGGGATVQGISKVDLGSML
jgi:hypothetical protein